MKRRLTFVRALLSDPELLILDEPTTGLDPTVRHLLWEKVLSFRQAGKTTLVTTHYMHEAELLCDRIVILNRGVVVGAGAPRELIAREAPGYVGIFAQDQEQVLRGHLQGRLGYLSSGPPMLHSDTANRGSYDVATNLRHAGASDSSVQS